MGTTQPLPKFQINKAKDKLCKTIVVMKYTSSPLDEVSNTITNIDAAEYKNEWYNNCEFMLYVRMFRKHQQ